jgi:dihydroorotase-like cyclic amidohydrolase
VLFDPDQPGSSCQALQEQIQNSPFDEMPVQGKALRTVVAGRTLYEAAP